MATVVNNLGFRMTSTWDPSGMAEARRDIEKFRAELEAISGSVKVDVEVNKAAEAQSAIDELTKDRRLSITVVLEGIDVAAAAIEALTQRRVASIQAEADVTRARAALDEVATRRRAVIQADADTTQARVQISEVSRNRRASIQLDLVETDFNRRLQAVSRRAQLEIPLTADGERFRTRLQELVKEIEGSTRIKFSADMDPEAITRIRRGIDQQIRELESAHARQTRQAPVREQLDAVETEFNRRLQTAAQRAEMRIPLTPDGESFRANLRRIVTELEGSTHVRFTPDMDPAAVSRIRQDIERQIRDIENLSPRNTQRPGNVDTSGIMQMNGLLSNGYVLVAALIGAFEALTAVAVALGAVLVTALGAGVIGAGLAVIAMNKNMTASQNEAKQAAQDHADTANTALVNAYKNVNDTASKGARDVADANRGVADAQRTVRDTAITTNLAVKDSQLAVNEAYKEARRDLEDLQLQQQQSGDDVEAARISLARAQERQGQLGSKGPVSGLDVREAINNTAQAQDRLNSVIEKANRTNEDANVATAKGVEGSTKVVKAKQTEAETERKAAESRQQAQQALTVATQKASQAQKDASDNNVKASQQLVQAQREASKAQTDLNKVIATGSDAMHTLVAQFAAMAEPLRGPANAALESLKNQLRDLAPMISMTFVNAVPLIQPFVDTLTGVAKNLIPGVNTALSGSKPVIEGFRDGMSSLAKGVGDMFADMKPAAKDMGDAWRIIGRESGKFFDLWGKFVGDTGDRGSKVLDGILMGVNALTEGVLGVSRFISAVFEPIGTGWSKLMDGFKSDKMTAALKHLSSAGDQIIKPLKQMFNDPQFQASLKDFTTNLMPKIVDMFANLGPLVGMALTGIVKTLPPLFDAISKTVTVIIQLVTWITSGLRMLGNLGTQVAEWFNNLVSSGDQWFISWDKMWKSFGAMLLDLWHTVSGAFTTAWNSFWSAIKDTSTVTWDAISGAFKSFGEGLMSGLRGIVDMARTVWNGIKDVFAKPINAIIGFSNDTIGKVISSAVIPKIPGYRTGGEVSGPGGPKDDLIHAMLSNKEFVVNAQGTEKNLAALHYANAGGTIIPGFKDGGSVGDGVGSGINGQGITTPIGWMTAQALAVAPSLKVTSTVREGDPGYHGKGKAVDFSNGSDDTPQMQAFASWIASTWGSKTLELIHSPFTHNIKNGKDVGDGMSMYGAGTMSEHRNHVHWAVDSALGDGKGGFLGSAASAAGSVLGGVRSVMGALFEKLTNPVLGAIPDPALGTGKPFGSFPKQLATKGRDDLANLLRGSGSSSTSSNAPMGGVVPGGEHLSIIDAALALTHTPPPGSKASWEAGMNTLIGRESGWNSAAINMTDSNAAAGHPSKGLAQTIDSTFASNAVPGHTNIWEPVDNVAASINYIRSRYGDIANVQQANANMPSRGYATGTTSAAPGWAMVGEKGPEVVNFKGGEEVTPLSQFSMAAQGAGTGFANANINQATSDLHIDTTGSGFIPQLFTQGFSYSQQLASAAEAKQGVFSKEPRPAEPGTNAGGNTGPQELHFHTVDMESALKKWNQNLKIRGMGFNI